METGQPEERNGSGSWMTEGILLAGATAVLYLMAYGYEFGWSVRFGLPLSMININVSSFAWPSLICVLGLMTVVFVLVIEVVNQHRFLQRSIKALNISREVYLPVLGSLFFALLISRLFIHAFQRNSPNDLGDGVGLSLFTWAGTLLGGSYAAGWLGKIAKRDAEPLGIIMIIRWAELALMGLHYILLLFTASFAAGYSNGRNQVGFLVMNEAPPAVVLRVNGDMVVSALFNPATRQVFRTFRITKLAEGKSLTLQFQNIGPLLPREPVLPLRTPAKSRQ